MKNELNIKTMKLDEKEFIDFLKKQGITVKTNTKARGNLGICFKNRIDISKKADKSRRVAILAHEYAHKIHFDLEKENFQKGGTLEKLFNTDQVQDIAGELLAVTHFVDEKSKFAWFYERKIQINQEIKDLEKIIRLDYPDFKRSYPFRQIKSYFRKNKSDAKYFLKYDNIKIVTPFLKREKLYRIRDIDKDFSEIPESLRSYLKFLSLQREYKRLYRRKNRAENYYLKPTELFARFVEGLFIDSERVQQIAPECYFRFNDLLKENYYSNLGELFKQIS